MYCTNRSMPARSPAGRYTDWSTLKPLCGQVRMFSTTSGSILLLERVKLLVQQAPQIGGPRIAVAVQRRRLDTRGDHGRQGTGPITICLANRLSIRAPRRAVIDFYRVIRYAGRHDVWQ